MLLDFKHRLLEITAAALAGAAVPLSGTARAQDGIAQFYRGRTIRLIVGAAAGAAYDFMARVPAAHYARYIPGNPNFVVENMPGAGSIVMLDCLAVRARQDGGREIGKLVADIATLPADLVERLRGLINPP